MGKMLHNYMEKQGSPRCRIHVRAWYWRTQTVLLTLATK